MTGLIYVVIIALWAAVLIPIWLRRHDQISEVRSTARFRSAMSTLGRQHSVESARMTAARRRATITTILVLLLATSLILTMLSTAPIWLPIAAAVLLAAYVAGVVLTASQRTQRTKQTQRPRRRTRATVIEERDEEVVVAEVAEAKTRRRRPGSLADDEEFLQWNAWDDDDAWEAIPQTLPTYVNAPRASSIPRPIDRAHDGEWSGSAMVRAAQAARRPVDDGTVVDHRDSTAEIPIVQRPAVNE